MADEIHALNKNEIQDIDYDTYFGEMDLSDEEKEDRKSLLKSLKKSLLCYLPCYPARKKQR